MERTLYKRTLQNIFEYIGGIENSYTDNAQLHTYLERLVADSIASHQCCASIVRDEALEEAVTAAKLIYSYKTCPLCEGNCDCHEVGRDNAVLEVIEAIRALKTYASKSEMKRVDVLKSKKGGE